MNKQSLTLTSSLSSIALGLATCMLLPAAATAQLAQVCNAGGVTVNGVPPFTPAVNCAGNIPQIPVDYGCSEIPNETEALPLGLASCVGENSGIGTATCYTPKQLHDFIVGFCNRDFGSDGYTNHCLVEIESTGNPGPGSNGWIEGGVEFVCGVVLSSGGQATSDPNPYGTPVASPPDSAPCTGKLCNQMGGNPGDSPGDSVGKGADPSI